MKRRCAWARNPLAIAYHDKEWGVPVRNDRKLFEFLILEGAQAGLSWDTILAKRANYRRAFHGFNAERISAYDAKDREQPLAILGVICRNSFSIKPVKCAPVIRALGEDGVPRKPGLRAFQDEELEELAVVADRHAPLLVVVGDGERIARPGASSLHATGTLRAKPSNRSSIRSRQEQSGSSGPSTSCGLITRAHWNTENRM